MWAQDNDENQLFKAFQNDLMRLQRLDKNCKYYDRDKLTLLRALLDIQQEIDLLVEIKDIRDEINIILSVLKVQHKVVHQMLPRSSSDFVLLQDSTVENMIKNDIAEFTRMENQAKSIQDKVRMPRWFLNNADVL